MPITEKNTSEQLSLSRESKLKRDAYNEKRSSEEKNNLSEIYLDDMVLQKGSDSLLAIIYIDGNNMGDKLKNITKGLDGYDECINAVRRFSEMTQKIFVDDPIKNIEKMLLEKQKNGIGYAKYRKVIAGGDEITLICNAHIVPDILDTYFASLEDANKNSNEKFFACAGAAIFHSHAPFADVYRIAEQCCESGKKVSRQYNSCADLIDFHFCRSGITNDMEIIREKQEKGLTARPYRVDSEHNGYSYKLFTELAERLKVIGRSNIKELASALLKGDPCYRFEAERINSRFEINIDLEDDLTKKMIFDTAQVYDLWFAETEEIK